MLEELQAHLATHPGPAQRLYQSLIGTSRKLGPFGTFCQPPTCGFLAMPELSCLAAEVPGCNCGHTWVPSSANVTLSP